MKQGINWVAVAKAWAVIEAELGPIGLAFSEDNATRVTERIDALLEATKASAPEPLFALLDALSDWLSEYEAHAVPIQHANPLELLRHLMESNDLKQADLAPLLGGQPIVSAILNGRRRINARQALALGRRFKLSPAAFLAAQDAEDVDMPRSVLSDQILEGIDLGEPSRQKDAVAVLPRLKWNQMASTESDILELVH